MITIESMLDDLGCAILDVRNELREKNKLLGEQNKLLAQSVENQRLQILATLMLRPDATAPYAATSTLAILKDLK